MKKLISLMICVMYFFSIISFSNQKKVEGVAIVAGYTIAEVIAMLLGTTALVSTGYVVGDNALNPDDNSDFTDWVTGEYLEYIRSYQNLPGAPPPPPKQLTTMEHATLTSLLTTQGIEVGNDVYDYIYGYLNPPSDVEPLPEPDQIINTISSGYNASTDTYPLLPQNRVTASGNTYSWKPEYLGKYHKITFYSGPLIGKFGYLFYSPEFVNTGSIINPIFRPIVKFISSNGIAVSFAGFNWQFIKGDGTIIAGQSEPYKIYEKVNFDGDYPPIVDTLLPDFLKPPAIKIKPEDYSPIFKAVDLSPLNGLVLNPDDMIGIVDGSIKTTPQKYKLIEKAWNTVLDNHLKNPNLEGVGASPVSPSIDPVTGNVVYGDPLLEEPVIESPEAPDTELSFWGKVLYWLKAIWQTLRDIALSILQIPGKIILPNADPWLQPLLDGLRDLFVPSADFITDKIDTFQDNFSFIETFRESVNWFETFRTSDGYPFVRVDLSKYHGTFNGQSVSMGEYAYILDLRFYAPYKFIGDLMITAFIYIMFIWKFFGRLPEIINGAGMISTTNAKIEQFEAKERKKK